MPTILTLTPLAQPCTGLLAGASAIAAGPDGLFAVRVNGEHVTLQPLAQPMSGLATAAVAGDRLVVGGSPHGTAAIPLADVAPLADGPGTQQANGWRAGWMDYTQQPVVALAAAPDAAESGTLLAATFGDGILRTGNLGVGWQVSNYGLADFRVLTLAWAPPAPQGRWPARSIVFAGSESGIHRSPAGGLAWRASHGAEGSTHALAVAHDFHDSGLVLAASSQPEEAESAEEPAPSTTLWRSTDGGRSFAPVAEAPPHCETLLATARGFVAGTPVGLWASANGRAWQPLQTDDEQTPGALCLLALTEGLLAGGGHGVALLPWRLLDDALG